MSVQIRVSNSQRRMAAEIFKCGGHNVWIDPELGQKMRQAITRADVKRLIKNGKIRKIKEKQKTVHEKASKQRAGSRKGCKHSMARMGKKSNWLRVIRPQRKLIKELKNQGMLKEGYYRKLYSMVKGNFFRSRAHLNLYLANQKLLVDSEKHK